MSYAVITDRNWSVGFYGIPGRIGGRTHLIAKGGRPVCGEKVHPKAEYQWCAWGAHLELIECRRCHDRAAKLRENTR